MIGFTSIWNKYLDLIPSEKQDLYFREEYVKLYETASEKALCFVYQDNEGLMLFPFLRRSFLYKGDEYFDFETAYGYGGPISSNDTSEFLSKALNNMMQTAISENYVCGFVRFHPLLKNWKEFDNFGKVIYDRKTIAIDMSMGVETAWTYEIHTKNRNVIKKGERNGLTFVADYEFKYLREFEGLYNATMDKLDADNFYYFTPQYYSNLQSTIKNKFLGIVKYGETIVAGAIFFFQMPYGHYHLSGSDKSYLNLSPNNFMIWSAAEELNKVGVKLFHLGGGTDGTEENSLYQFKKKFSRGEYQFVIGKMIFNQSIYDSLCSEWILANQSKAEKYKNVLLKYKY